eukprot:1052678_1
MAQLGGGSGKKGRQQYSRSVGCPTTNVVNVLCKNSKGKYLSVQQDIPSFCLSHSDKYAQYLLNGTIAENMKTQYGINIEINGILRIEHTENNGESGNMIVTYYAEPLLSESKSKLTNAKWIDVPPKDKMNQNNNLYSWISYLEYEGGIVYPMNVFTLEGESVKIADYKMPAIQNHDANYTTVVNRQTDKDNDNDEQKEQ